jgi:hypothetical protein
MHRTPLNPDGVNRKSTRIRSLFPVLILLVLPSLMLQSGCLFRKRTPAAAPTLPAPVRIILLPVNAPEGRADLRWTALAATVQMAEIAVAAPDLEPMPLWESTPAVLQTLGNSRTITAEIAEFTADRLTARWATVGDLLTVNKTPIMRLDFVPSRASLVPFRYEKPGSIDALAPHFQEAFTQFLRYLIVRPLMEDRIRHLDPAGLRAIGEAVDAEYGWFVPAKPGAAGKLVDNLAISNRTLARLLFNPTLYPVLAK